MRFDFSVSGVQCTSGQSDRFGRCMSRVHVDFHIKYSRETTETLSADTERVDLVAQFNTQFFGFVLWATLLKLVHVDAVHQGLFCHQHRFLSGTTDTNTQHTWWTPACTHGWHSFHNPIH